MRLEPAVDVVPSEGFVLNQGRCNGIDFTATNVLDKSGCEAECGTGCTAYEYSESGSVNAGKHKLVSEFCGSRPFTKRRSGFNFSLFVGKIIPFRFV